MQYVSVRSVASRIKSQFKIDIDIFEAIQSCSDALKKMGMIALDRKGYVTRVENYVTNLPADVWKVRSVTRLDNVPSIGINVIEQEIYFPPQIVFTYDEPATVKETSEFQANVIPQLRGPYIDYKWDAPYLRFNETDIPILVEATGLKLDEEEMPMIPEPAFYGCLYYTLFVYYQPLFLLGQVPPLVWKEVEKWKNDNIGQANSNMMLEALSGNEKDNLFNIMTSFDRKSYNYPI